jgi:hypothetical protein
MPTSAAQPKDASTSRQITFEKNATSGFNSAKNHNNNGGDQRQIRLLGKTRIELVRWSVVRLLTRSNLDRSTSKCYQSTCGHQPHLFSCQHDRPTTCLQGENHASPTTEQLQPIKNKHSSLQRHKTEAAETARDHTDHGSLQFWSCRAKSIPKLQRLCHFARRFP